MKPRFASRRLLVEQLEDRTVPSVGSIDVAFGTGGFSTANFGVNDHAVAVALGTDGKIVEVGDAALPGGQGQDFAIARFLPDGQLDPTFDGDGRLLTSLSSSHDYARDVIVLDDGKILIAGGGLFGRNYDFILARFNANGSRDGSFGSSGVTTTNFDGNGRDGSHEQAAVMLRRSDGRLVLIGSSNLNGLSPGPDAIGIAQYSASGVLDNSFGKVLTLASTLVTNGYQVEPTSATLDASGGIIVVGSVRTGDGAPWRLFVARYNSDGSRDTAFGTATIERDFTDNYYLDDQVAVRTDGKIVVAFTANSYADPKIAIARLNADGTFDGTFGSGGVRNYSDTSIWRVQALAIQSDGKLVISGQKNGAFVSRFLEDGTPDPTFGVNGFQDLASGAYLDAARDLAIRTDGKIVIAGSTFQLDAGRGFTDFGVVRLEGDTPSAPLPPGITVVPSAQTTHETDGGAWLRMILNSQPTANVIIGLSSTDTTEGVPSVSSVTFTPANWNVPQLIGVYSVDDTIADGNVAFTIVTAAAVSADPAYNGINTPDFTFTNLDNESTGGKKKLQAASLGTSTETTRLTHSQIAPILEEVLSRWTTVGANTSIMRRIDIRIADLPGTTLGTASGHTIWLDASAAGWGWFIDATPRNDSEFTTPGDQGEQGRMDLLTAIAHELGHLLGFDHADDGTMHDTLSTGERHTPTPIVTPVEPAVFDLIFIEEKNKKTTWSSDRLVHELLSDLNLAPVR